MDELRPEDLEGLVQEPAEDPDALDPIPRKVRVCPKCGKHNLESAWHCGECGQTLSIETLTDKEAVQRAAKKSPGANEEEQWASMEELQPQDIEDHLRELVGLESTAQALPPEVEEALHNLHAASLSPTRRDAAEQLGKVGTSNPQIVRALIGAFESDPSSMVNRAAAKSLRAPMHQEYLQQHPDLMEAADRALQQRPGADKQRPLSDTISMPLDEEDVDSFLSRVFHDPRWKWAPVYAVFFLVTAALVFAVDSLWTLLAAGVVWFAGSVLGLVILQRKGYSVGGFVFELVDVGDDSLGCLLALLALLALAGPVILLIALLVRPRGSGASVSKRRAGAKAADRGRPAPAHGGDLPSDCPACGAWNAPGSEICGECGVALAGAEV